ncbi:MAG: ATP-dependent 6-phosphofructokinase [Clostridia bacterium]|jgi:phosphofructokinase-like protein|nr:ATP-dependent 6-phosphofructokinase [Clostridia bacterium]MBP9479699.1 ATP-dependent 6-phosphofructokinase [Sebaldella sp.]MED9924724.1 ATP-dependent 6-phosphofructokinase [Clostridia bacterium]
MLKKVGILANGGDVSGFNAVIRAIVKTAENHGVECYGIVDGYNGLLKKDFEKLSTAANGEAVGILPKGGSIIGSSTNANIFNYKIVNEDGSVEYKDLSEQAIENIKEFGFDCIFTLGGDGTQKSARDFSTKGVNIIGVPKTIDNDVACTEITFGYNTAVSVAMEALDRLHTTGETHHRIMVLEVMGRYAGWIALESAIAGGADVALIPEIPYDINKVATKIENRKKRGKNFSIVVVAEGAKPKDGEMVVQNIRNNGAGVDNTKLGGVGQVVAKQLEELTGLEARNTTLGYMQRGGTPTAFDRVLSTKYGSKAMELALEGKFGTLVVIKNGKLDSASLEDVVGNNTKIGAVSGNTAESNLRKVTMDDDLVKAARDIGINLGD